MQNSSAFGDVSPYEKYYHVALPSLTELTNMPASELSRLGVKLAHAYEVDLAGYDMDQISDIVYSPREYGVQLKRARSSTILSLAARLKDRKWWGRQITQIADEMREHYAQKAGMLGGKNSAMSCCSDATVEIFRERKERTDYALKSQFKVKNHINGDKTVFSLHEIAESAKRARLNELFLSIKALETIAERNSYGCAFITLTAAPQFHSNPKRGKSTYDGSSARAANLSIQKDWRSILDGLDNIGVKRKSGSYFGFRVVELHEDGCPHWHILIFFDKTLGILDSLESSLQRLYKSRGAYFERQKEGILRIIAKTDDQTAQPSSYIFKYIAYALGAGEADGDGLAYRYKCAIRAMRARQYGFFGVKCAIGKQRALRSIANAENAPEHLSRMAKELYLPKDTLDRNEKQLQARVRFLEGGADELEVSQEVVENRYGETMHVNRWIKHRDDDDAAQYCGLCEDISEAEAKRLREIRKSKDEHGKEEPVTVVVNYSSKGKVPNYHRPDLARRVARYRHDRGLASHLGITLADLYSGGIVTRAPSLSVDAGSTFRTWCIATRHLTMKRANSPL